MSDPFALERRQQARARAQLRRQRLTLVPVSGSAVQVVWQGQSLINFCSNDYLGLTQHAAVRSGAEVAAARWGAGSGASHLVCGHFELHEQLEQALAEWVGRPRALLFSTGYMANTGVISALLNRDHLVLQDRLNHASLLDGALLSRARLQRYRHADVDHLQTLLAATERPTLVVTDSVFSMDGDIAPLADLGAVCRDANAWLMVDDAHGIGVLGAGHGVLATPAGAAAAPAVYVGTLGKALGSFGAFVAGEATLIDALIDSARSYIYTTALPPAAVGATLAALQVLGEEPERVERLQQRIGYFRSVAMAAGLPLLTSDTPIQPILIGDNEKVVALAAELRKAGFLVAAIRPPTVPVGEARLRITLSSEHTELDIDRLVAALATSYVDISIRS